MGAGEVSFTVLSMSISLVAVFIPILLMGGIVGRLFREFSITLSIAVLVSLVISLTTTPMMCSRLIRLPDPASRGACFTSASACSKRMLHGYGRSTHAGRSQPSDLMVGILAVDHRSQHLSIRRDSEGVLPRSRTPAGSSAVFRPTRPFPSSRCRRSCSNS